VHTARTISGGSSAGEGRRSVSSRHTPERAAVRGRTKDEALYFRNEMVKRRNVTTHLSSQGPHTTVSFTQFTRVAGAEAQCSQKLFMREGARRSSCSERDAAFSAQTAARAALFQGSFHARETSTSRTSGPERARWRKGEKNPKEEQGRNRRITLAHAGGPSLGESPIFT